MPAMKIVHPICCGMDIHKKLIVATIARTGPDGVTTYSQRQFSTMHPDLVRLRDWLVSENCPVACMESTGKYWIPIWSVLEEKVTLTLAHPKYTKAIRGKKTDSKDSKWIADLFKHDLVPNSFIPPAPIRAMREIFRYRYKLVCVRTGEKNRIQNSMTVSSIRIDNVVSDPFGKSARSLMDAILGSGGDFDPKACGLYLEKGLKKKEKEIRESLEGMDLRDEQSVKMQLAYGHLDYLDSMIGRTVDALDLLAKPHEAIIASLMTIPGMSRISAIGITSEIGTDMDAFADAEHLASWAGLTPACNESANKKKSVRISKAGTIIKPLLVQVANAAVRCKDEPYYAVKYERLKRRRGHKKAIIAIARMILVACYHMVRNGETFDPTDIDRKTKCPKYVKASVRSPEEMVEFLTGMGYKVEAPVQSAIC